MGTMIRSYARASSCLERACLSALVEALQQVPTKARRSLCVRPSIGKDSCPWAYHMIAWGAGVRIESRGENEKTEVTYLGKCSCCHCTKRSP